MTSYTLASYTITWEQFWQPIWLSLQFALIASILALIAGTFAARSMHSAVFKGKALIETLLLLPLVLPPTVVGFILLVVFGRRSMLGQAVEWLTAQPIVFTGSAAVIASIVVAFPLVYQSMKTGFLSIDAAFEDAARSAGASEWQVLRFITLPLCSRAMVSAYILGFARALGEFGATIMFAGNIPGRTQTLPTAIYVAVDNGHTGLAWTWTFAIMIISFLLLGLTGSKVLRN